MKNLKNIIASIILVAISFVSYTQDTLKYEFYLTDNTDIENVTVNTFEVTNTVTHGKFSLSTNTWDLGELNSNMNFTMNDTIYKHPQFDANDTIDGAYVTGIFLISEDYGIHNYQNFNSDLKQLEGLLGDNILYIDNVEDFITTLRDTSKTYVHVVFRIEYIKTVQYDDNIYSSNKVVYTGFAIDYTVAAGEETTSIDTEVIEVSNTRVYPNPVMNSLNIEFETINTDTEVEIYSTNGQLMYKDVEYRNFGINKVSVDMSNYQPGMYIVKLGNVVKKVIKQ